jgi:hypothetical protein
MIPSSPSNLAGVLKRAIIGKLEQSPSVRCVFELILFNVLMNKIGLSRFCHFCSIFYKLSYYTLSGRRNKVKRMLLSWWTVVDDILRGNLLA